LSYDSSGKKLLVLGATPRSAWSGKAKGGWTLNVVDVGSLKNMALGEVGLPPVRPLLDAVHERVYVLGEGAKNEPAVLTVFGLAKNEELARLKTAPGGVGLLLSPSGRRLYVLHGGDILGKKEPPSKLMVFDTEALKVAAEEPLPPRAVAMALGPDGAPLYVLSRGGKSKEGPAAQGKLLVLAAEAGTVIARLDVGSEARHLTVDRKRGLVYVLGEDAAGGPGWLTIVKSAEIKGRVAVPVDGGGVRSLQDDRPIYVLGDEAIVAVDPAAPSVLRTWRLDFDPAEILFDATRSRAYAAPGAGSEIAQLDLTNGVVVASLKTGRKGTKAGKAIGSVLLGAATGVVLYGRGSTAMTLRPDGEFLYAINAYTDDLTIIDTEKHEVADYISTGGGTWRIAAPPKSAHLYVESTDRLTRISMTDHKVIQEIPLRAEGQPRRSIRFDIPRARAFIPKGNVVDVLDLATGDNVASVRLTLPVSVVVEPGRPVKNGEAAGSQVEEPATPTPSPQDQ
jgi:YVTN family beta-propeller protein